jgi:hypothetical protein
METLERICVFRLMLKAVLKSSACPGNPTLTQFIGLEILQYDANIHD